MILVIGVESKSGQALTALSTKKQKARAACCRLTTAVIAEDVNIDQPNQTAQTDQLSAKHCEMLDDNSKHLILLWVVTWRFR